uniref:Uncharacterized protein n=1 Tax=Sphaerodactylus townsendi TaxID=933632 RepID=A0ACB8G440_9SAUR
MVVDGILCHMERAILTCNGRSFSGRAIISKRNLCLQRQRTSEHRTLERNNHHQQWSLSHHACKLLQPFVWPLLETKHLPTWSLISSDLVVFMFCKICSSLTYAFTPFVTWHTNNEVRDALNAQYIS